LNFCVFESILSGTIDANSEAAQRHRILNAATDSDSLGEVN